ncbi:GNAT family N-acetyltransferase [Pelomonas sp. V22]|uniref:GNAT family N-acetyltransferase n=1 Tax=Pelomonas sp. V22 TaxID=2822139 RepID=UPI0024A95C59|nr:GNAT family protein [Pelomonas sp. V22]MDI4632605.1 GNAT family N-acetyltransferase [Pelomonas sp. V22]
MILSERIGLRHATEADLPLLIKMAADPGARGDFLPKRMRAPGELAKQFGENGFSSDEYEMLLICDRRDPQQRVIGNVVHFRARSRYTTAREIGWTIFDPTLRGQGYAGEAARLLVDYLFENFQQVYRLECTVSVHNGASRGVAEKIGFQHEALARGLLYVGGQPVDANTFGLIRPEWEARAR